MTNSERKRLKALELSKIEQENFENWVSGWKLKRFDLTKSPDEILWDIYNAFANGEIPTTDTFVKMAFSSYYFLDRKFSEQFEDYANLKIKNIKKLFEYFLYDVTGEKCENFNYQQTVDLLAKHTCDLLTKVFGNAVYLNFKPVNYSNVFKASLIKELSANGFVDSAETNIYINSNHPYSDFKSGHQQWLKETYLNVLKKLLVDFPAYDKLRLRTEEFDGICKIAQDFLTEIKKHMTQETLNDPQVIETLKLEEKLFNCYLSNKKSKIPQEKRGQYFELIYQTIKKLDSGVANEEDKKVFAEFVEKCKTLKQAISIVDKDGTPYCLHYFVFMPINTHSFGILLNYAEKCKAVDKHTKKFFSDLKAQLSVVFQRNFNSRKHYGRVDIDDVFAEFKDLKSKTKDIEVNLYNEKTLENFKQKTKQIVEEYNLPKTEECIKIINMDLLRGRNPINLGSLDPVKKVKVK